MVEAAAAAAEAGRWLWRQELRREGLLPIAGARGVDEVESVHRSFGNRFAAHEVKVYEANDVDRGHILNDAHVGVFMLQMRVTTSSAEVAHSVAAFG